MSSSAYIPPHRRNQQNSTSSPPNQRTTTTKRHQRWGTHPYTDDDDDALRADASQELAAAAAARFTRICCINLRRREDRWTTFCCRMRSVMLGDNGRQFIEKVERFDAVDGAEIMARNIEGNGVREEEMPRLDWDASKNALYDRHIQPPMTKRMTPGEVGCAMSHVRLWKQLANSEEQDCTMLILEDDAECYKGSNSRSGDQRGDRGHSNRNRNHMTPGFPEALSSAWRILPSDWDILYLGFSDRGERTYVQSKEREEESPIHVQLFRPTYGFHTHAYALSKSAASVLLSNLPVNGPLDVWLADNEWFGLNAYCSIVANEGWHERGANLISQQRQRTQSDINQSGRG
jgi:GR25 family glycosyltransferase involved in LPS biosynthesis